MTQLADVLLSSSKKATTGWAALTGRTYDVTLDDYGASNWSVACNLAKIDVGTIGWIARADGNWGHIAGLLAVQDQPYKQIEANGEVWYAPGVVFPLPREWWVDGARLHLGGWPNRAPFGRGSSGRRMAVFRSGESVPGSAVALIEHLLHPVVLEWVKHARSGQVAL